MKRTLKQFRTVLGHELAGYFVRKKTLTVVTLLMIAVVGVVVSWPRITALSGPERTADPSTGPDRILAVYDEVHGYETIAPLLAAALSDRSVAPLESGDPEAARGRVANGDFDSALLVTGPQSYQYVAGDTDLYDAAYGAVDEILTQLYRREVLAGYGVGSEEADGLFTLAVRGEVVQAGKDQGSNFLYTYIMIFLMYMAILIYGQLVASGVTEEKSSRAMELLITSARPPALMFGKVIAAAVAGMAQLTAVLAAALLFYRLNESFYAGNGIVSALFSFPPALLAHMIALFILGFFLYSFLFAALASLCSRAEELSQTTMPVMFLFIGFFMAVLFTMVGGGADSSAMRVLSWIPFSSPMGLFVRIAMTRVPWWESALSYAVLAGTTVVVGAAAAGIYRLGVLLYGKPPKPSEILRLLRTRPVSGPESGKVEGHD